MRFLARSRLKTGRFRADCARVSRIWEGIPMNQLNGMRVLLVEDEPVIAMDHAEQLQREGAEVVGPFPATHEAIRELNRSDFDVAVIDYVLTDDNSRELQKELDRHHVPFVVVTAYPKVLVRSSDDQAVLSKPLAGNELCETVKQMVDEK